MKLHSARVTLLAALVGASLLVATPALADIHFSESATLAFGIDESGVSNGTAEGWFPEALALFRATEEGQRIEKELSEANVTIVIWVEPEEKVADGEAYGTAQILGRDEAGNVTDIRIDIAATGALGPSQLANTLYHELRHAEEYLHGNRRHIHRALDAQQDPQDRLFDQQVGEVAAAAAAAEAEEEAAAEPEIIAVESYDTFGSLGSVFGAKGGGVTFLTPDPADDATDCDSGAPVTGSGADITGVVARQEDDVLTIGVAMAVPPTESSLDFSFAVLPNLVTESGESRSLIWEIHAGEQRTGELTEDAANAWNVDTDISPEGVSFRTEIDPADPPLLIAVQGFHTMTSSDAKTCDESFAVAIPFPGPLAASGGSCEPTDTTGCLHDGRFSAAVVDGSGLSLAPNQIEVDTLGFVDGEGDAVVRVINGCEINEHFWLWTGSSPSVSLTITIVDTATGETRLIDVTPETSTSPVLDTQAFATCP